MTIKEAREKAGLTQAQVYKLVGIPARTLQDWEAGRRHPPEWAETLIAERLNLISHIGGDDIMQITKCEIDHLQSIAFEQFKAVHGVGIFGEDIELRAYEISEENRKIVELVHPDFTFTDTFLTDYKFDPDKAKIVLLFTVNMQTKQLVWQNKEI